LHCVAVGCASVLYFVLDDPSLVLIIAGTLMCVTYLVLGMRESQRTMLRLTPLSFYFFWYSIDLGVSAIWIGTRVADGEPVRFSTVSVAHSDLATGYLIFLVGSLALHAGMQCFRPNEEGDRARRVADLPAGIVSLAIMYAVGLAALFGGTALARTPLGSLGGILQWASLGALSCFALTRPAGLGLSSAGFKTILAIGMVGLFLGELNSDSKELIMYSTLPLFWLLLIRPRFRLWLPLMLASSVLVYSLVSRIVWISRNVELPDKERFGASVAQMTDAYDYWRSGVDVAPSTSATEQVDQFLERLFDPIPIGFIVDRVRQSGFMMGETMSYAAYSFIPRLIWPDKPDVTRGAWFTYYLGFADSPESATTATGQTATGELYWNFGLGAVLVGMFVIGVLFGGLWRMAGNDPHEQPVRMLLYVLVMTRTTQQMEMAEAVSAMVGVASMFVIFGTTFWFLKLFGRPLCEQRKNRSAASRI
jgi:hypothetical protein